MNNGYQPDPDACLTMARISDILGDPRVEQHFTQNRNKMAAIREVLDLFGVPHPEWAQRKLSGRGAANKAAMNRYLADHPQELLGRSLPSRS